MNHRHTRVARLGGHAVLTAEEASSIRAAANQEDGRVTVERVLRGDEAAAFVRDSKMPTHQAETVVDRLKRAAAVAKTAVSTDLRNYAKARKRLGDDYSPVKVYTAEEAVKRGFLLPEAQRVSLLDMAMASAPTHEEFDKLPDASSAAKLLPYVEDGGS